MLSFVVPIRHPDNVTDRPEQFRHLGDTFRSIGAQEGDDWEVIVVANPRQILPELARNMRVRWVEFPPNAATAEARTIAEFYGTIQFDKGRRVEAAADEIDPDASIMVVDDDDLVHRGLAKFIASRGERCGWRIDLGYVWLDGSAYLRRAEGFNTRCGTSLIVPREFYLKYSGESFDAAQATRELGSHKLIFEHIPANRPKFRDVPFRAAIYRLGHQNASQRLIDLGLGQGNAAAPARGRLSRYLVKVARLLRTRRLSGRLERDFFGR